MRGTVIEVKTAMPAKLLAALVKEGIPTGDATRMKNGVRFTVKETYTAKTFAFLENLCYTYTVAAHTGVKATLKKAAFRLGLVAGVAAVVAVYALSGRHIWRIRVDGNEQLSDKAVVEMLSGLGVKTGGRSDFDFAAIERAMRGQDGISECALSLRGTTLTVTVIEQAEITPPETSDGRADVVSLYDATVTRVVCEKGTARVRPGDAVAAGAVLIEGASYSTLGDDYGNPVLLQEFRAKGEVFGAVVFRKSLAVPAEKTEYVRTGRKKTRTSLGLFGLNIGRENSPFDAYEAETSEGTLDFIPIRCRRITFYETEAVTVQTDAEATAAAAIAELTDGAALKSAKILSSTHTITGGNGLLYINCYVTAEMPIGELKG